MSSRYYTNRRLIISRRLLALAGVLGFIGGLLVVSSRPAQAQSESGLWNEPVNLSKSGSASSPVIAAEPNGRIHVMWWDQFDGIKYTHLADDGSWSDPITATGIYGARVRGSNGRVEINPPNELTLFTDSRQQVFAFWRTTLGDVMFARTGSNNPRWSGGARLITDPLVWRIVIAPDNSLNLVYIRASSANNTEPGYYYRRSRDGNSWTTPELVANSLYFRTLPAGQANLSLSLDDSGQMLVGWDDPQTHQSYMTRSSDNGATFEPPVLVVAGGIAEVGVPTHVRFITPPGGGFIRLWEAGESCILYQQSLSADGTWTAPVRAIEKVSGCLRSVTAYPAEDGRLFLTIGSNYNSQSALTVWDGITWADPLMPQTSFINSATDDLVALGCVTLSTTQKAVTLLGCDRGDIWVLSSQVALKDFMPTFESDWSRPIILSKGEGDAGLPSVTVDQQGRFHAVWSQLPAFGNPGNNLTYIRGDGDIWSDLATILQVSNGMIHSASLTSDPNGILHLLWSGGATGQAFYSQAFARDAMVASDWEAPRELPAVQEVVGDSPNIVIGASGQLYAIYAIPYNEDRGLYAVASSDLGQLWSAPTRIFDAAAAGWGAIHQADLIVDRQENLHAVWTRAASLNGDSPLGIYYARSTDHGVTWTEPLSIRSDVDSLPKLAASSDNTLHLVWAHTTLNGYELVHQWSSDAGQTWSIPARVPGLAIVAPDVDLAADLAGSVYLMGVELTRESSAGLFYLRWDGTKWTDRDTVRLGYDFSPGSGVRLAVLPAGRLGVFYRVQIPNATLGTRYVVGYVGRKLSDNVEVTPAPTFTPRPLSTSFPIPTAAPTFTPIPIPDLNNEAAGGSGNNSLLIQIGVVAGVMALISAIAIFRLWGRVGR